MSRTSFHSFFFNTFSLHLLFVITSCGGVLFRVRLFQSNRQDQREPFLDFVFELNSSTPRSTRGSWGNTRGRIKNDSPFLLRSVPLGWYSCLWNHSWISPASTLLRGGAARSQGDNKIAVSGILSRCISLPPPPLSRFSNYIHPRVSFLIYPSYISIHPFTVMPFCATPFSRLG